MMISSSSCIVCGNAFAYRKGKLYCSNSCKTKGFLLKKSGGEIQNPSILYNQSRSTFFLSDYENMKHGDICSFELYCFLTKNFNDSEDPVFLNKYVETIVASNDFETDFKNSKSPLRSKFVQFLDFFYDGKYKILKDRT